MPKTGKQSIWRQCPPSARKQSTKKLPNRPGFTHVQKPHLLNPPLWHSKLFEYPQMWVSAWRAPPPPSPCAPSPQQPGLPAPAASKKEPRGGGEGKGEGGGEGGLGLEGRVLWGGPSKAQLGVRPKSGGSHIVFLCFLLSSLFLLLSLIYLLSLVLFPLRQRSRRPTWKLPAGDEAAEVARPSLKHGTPVGVSVPSLNSMKSNGVTHISSTLTRANTSMYEHHKTQSSVVIVWVKRMIQ